VPSAAPRKKRKERLEQLTLQQLCSRVIRYESPFEDVEELIENNAYAACDQGGFDAALRQLRRLAAFFERMKNKNEEQVRDLVDIYVFIGEMFQCYEKFDESIEWFRKAVAACDLRPEPYHSLATTYLKLNDTADAVKCLEQEVQLAPGNYFSYLTLADLYESQGQQEKAEGALRRLLERDPGNIQGLHRLIRHFERVDPRADVELLRRRIITAGRDLNKVELIIWTYHMVRLKRYKDALKYLTTLEDQSPEVTIVHLLKAYVYGEIDDYAKKRLELAKLKSKNDGREIFVINKLREFEDVFGMEAVQRLSARLVIADPAARPSERESPAPVYATTKERKP